MQLGFTANNLDVTNYSNTIALSPLCLQAMLTAAFHCSPCGFLSPLLPSWPPGSASTSALLLQVSGGRSGSFKNSHISQASAKPFGSAPCWSSAAHGIRVLSGILVAQPLVLAIWSLEDNPF